MDVNVKNDSGKSCLLVAAEERKLEVYEILIEKGCSIDEKYNNKNSCLIIARGDSEMIKFLIEKGRSMNDKDKYGDTNLLIAVNRRVFPTGHLELVKFLK